MNEPDQHAVAATADRERAEEWSLVLAAAEIPHTLEGTTAGWRLLVAPEVVAAAATALAAYDAERNAPVAGPPALDRGHTPAGVVVAALLVAFFGVTGPRNDGVVWFQAGSGDAERILHGAPWRTVTALTLHADAAHVLGNAVSGAVCFTAVFRALGTGVGGWLVLAAGAGGNALNAFLHGTPHRTIGASTAVFGAIGILGGLQFVHRSRPTRRRPWVPLAASLGLLAMLGTGQGVDLPAHLFGLALGIMLGVAAAPMAVLAPRLAVQRLLALGALGVVIGSWLAALS